MAGTDKRKQSLYFPEEIIREYRGGSHEAGPLALLGGAAGVAHRTRAHQGLSPAVNYVTGEPALPDTREEA